MDILPLFSEFLEKQDVLSKLTEHEMLHTYGTSEIHVIAVIKDHEHANVTLIAKVLHMTKGAISKITRKLMNSAVIETYLLSDNRQKIYFQLTAVGERLYVQHAKRHALWIQRDEQFLAQFTQTQLQEIQTFMIRYNQYLAEQIDRIGGH